MATRVRRRRRRGKKSRTGLKVLLGAALVCLAAMGIAAGLGAAWAIKAYNSAPPLSSLKVVQKGRSSAIYAADGSLIGFIRSDNIRQPVLAKELPPSLKNATVAIEDKNFYEHGGVDYASIVRAFIKDVEAGGKPVQGASTITQQLVRNLYIQDPSETLKRKLIEAKLANEEEDAHSKRWILAKYLNTAPYGTVEGETAVGAEAAAQTYFGKHASDLTLPQAALLAGLPQAPSEYNPFIDPQAARARRNEVLVAMRDQGYITPARYRAVSAQGLNLTPGHKYQTIHDPFLYDLVLSELNDRYGVNTVRNGGLKAYTSIDPTLQEYAQEAVDNSCYVCATSYDPPAAALASVDPQTGAIVALASTQSYSQQSQFNYASQAQRQPGSSFKTFVLATAIKQGIDPASTYYDGTSPITLDNPGGGTFTVSNAEPGLGVMSLAEATWQSVNVVFAQLDLDVGPKNVTHTAHSMGITSPLQSIPAEAIGGLRIGVTPVEMANAYGTLADGGVRHDVTALSKVKFPNNGKVDEASAADGTRVLTEGEAYEVTKLLEGVITQGTGAGYTSIGCTGEAGKTGTSEGESDAWFVGYTPLYSTAVWVGHPENRNPTGFGGPTAGPIWQSYMANAAAGRCPDFPVPDSLPELHSLSSSNTRSASDAYTAPAPTTTTPTKPDKSANAAGPSVNAPTTQPPVAAPPAAPPSPPPAAPTGPPPSVGGGVTPH